MKKAHGKNDMKTTSGKGVVGSIGKKNRAVMSGKEKKMTNKVKIGKR